VSDLAYIALGSNIGDRLGFLRHAREAIAAIPNCRIVGETSVDETEPLGGLEQPPYLNQMLAVETTLEPHALLDHLHRIETAAGRDRSTKWSSRTLDLDIVRFDDRVVNTATLTIPHPGFADRAFWQREVAELDQILNRTSDE
jgi:2-amino-4-hydroxy-6-hydroxymethyldihydropteridine diphosphokinase